MLGGPHRPGRGAGMTETLARDLLEAPMTDLAAVLKSMTCSGRGVAWLPSSQITKELDSEALVVAGDDSWRVPVEICLYRSREPLPPRSEDFWSFVASTTAS